MTSPFVTELRAGGDAIVIGGGEGPMLHLRVQAAELWETLRLDAPPSTSLASVKDAALQAFFPNGASPGEFVAKVRGFEILHEGESLEKCGIRDGSTILLAQRRRRPVR